MNSLIIHPNDESTKFLKNIYEYATNYTLVTGGVTKNKLIELINCHERIIIMGHGSPAGLFSIGQFKTAKYVNEFYIIDDSIVNNLSKANELVTIWCYADHFIKRYNLKALYTGMFISEMGEARICGYNNVCQEEIDESNQSFASIIGKYIHKDNNSIYKKLKTEYGRLARKNQIVNYNHQRLYISI